jgi:hypothetical protein
MLLNLFYEIRDFLNYKKLYRILLKILSNNNIKKKENQRRE